MKAQLSNMSEAHAREEIEKSSFGEKGGASYRPLKLKIGNGVSNIFCKLHVGEPDYPLKGRTMFVTGLPLQVDGEALGKILTTFGDVEAVVEHRTGVSLGTLR